MSLELYIGFLLASSLIAIVLLQRGKGAEAGAAFGAGASGTVFGSRGSSSFLSRTTAVLATLFFVTSLTLAYLSSQRPTEPESLLEGSPVLEEAVETIPVLDEEEAPEADMPALEPAGEDAAEAASDMPALEPETPAGEDNQ